MLMEWQKQPDLGQHYLPRPVKIIPYYIVPIT